MINIKSGDLARVWKDSIKGSLPFREQFPILFDVCNDQDCTVDKFKFLNAQTSFRRRLNTEMPRQWGEMSRVISEIQLCEGGDQVFWGFNGSDKYTTKSMYKWLENPLSGCHYKWIWKAKVPLKIKIFMWQLAQDAVLTRQVMKKKKWPGNPCCSFCNEVETSQHLFFKGPVARVVLALCGDGSGNG